jgi:multidrug efflux pump subunit AcrA (membrane-fusion protein)
MRIGALFVVLLGCGGTDKAAATSGPPPVPVKVATLAAQPLDRVLSATGTVETVESTDIRPESQGLVEEVLFQDGAVVKRGDPLVRLRAQDARASVLDAQARACSRRSTWSAHGRSSNAATSRKPTSIARGRRFTAKRRSIARRRRSAVR